MRSLLLTGSGSKFTEPLLRRLVSRFDSITLLSKTSPHRFTQNNISGLNFDLSSSYKIPVMADVVIHLAAVVPYNQKGQQCGEVLNTNLRCFLNVMRYAVSVGVRHVVLVSSTDIYPLLVDDTIRADTPPAPHNEYGLSKLACERIGRMLSEMYSIPLSIMRVGPIYSEDDPTANTVSGMLEALRRHRPITVPEPCNVPSLLHLESAVDGIVAALSAPEGTFVIAGRPMSIGDFFSLAKDAYRSSSEISLGSTSNRSVHISFDIADSEMVLGWSPFSDDKMFLAMSTTVMEDIR